MLKRIVNILLVIFTTFFLFACNNSKDENKLITGKLENGLTYYIYPNKAPKNNATLNLVVKVGSLMEDDKEQGIAHFMEHMAFNGTKKYKKNEMIKYLQSLGLDFGGDLNAYTTFDRTVFKLQIPTDDKDLEDGIEVLREWASNATLDSSEIEGEKNVVLEEWRLSQGLSQRLGDVQKKALFEGSRYFDRFPIGKPEIIKNANRELVEGFYKKWYQPQNMAVIAVGDFNPDKVEKLIKKYFTYKAENNNTPKDFPLKPMTNKYVVFTDKEIKFNNLGIIKLDNREIIKNERTLKNALIDDLLFGIINTRMNLLTTEKNSPLIYGEIFSSPMTKDKEFIEIAVRLKNDKTKEGIELINSFFQTINKQGLSETELKLEKENILNEMKSIVLAKDNISNNIFASDLVNLSMYGETFMDVEKQYTLYKKLMKDITLNDINTRLHSIVNLNSLYFLIGNDKLDIDKTKLKDIIKDSEDKVFDKSFNIKQVTLDAPKIKDGKIKESTINSSKDFNYILGNSIEVYTKNNKIDKNQIYIKLFKKEGTSSDSFKDFINGTYCTNIIQASGPSNLSPKDISTYMKGKNFSINTYISNYTQGIEITSDKDNLNNALDYMTALIYTPKIDDNIYNNYLAEIKENIKTRDNSPQNVFFNRLLEISTGNNKRLSPISLDDVGLLNKEEALKIYKEKFNNFYGYKLLIVGSLDNIDLKPILEKYFASLPATKNNKTVKPLDINIPKNIVTETVKKGIDKKTTTILFFPYKSQYGFMEKTLYSGFSKVLNIALIEDIREKIGGVYSISSFVSLSPNNYGKNNMIIYYSSDPARVNEIKNAVLSTLNGLLNENIDNIKIQNVVKNYEVNYPIKREKNSFWLNYLYNKTTIKDYKLATPKEFKEIMTSENLQNYNKKAIDLNNYIDITLVPESLE